MSATVRSYLDYAVLPPLRRKFLGQQAALLLSSDIGRVFWANAAGARLIAGTTVAELIGRPLAPSQPLVRQIHAAARQLRGDEPVVRGLRIARGLHTDLIRCRFSRPDLDGDRSAILLEADDKRHQAAMDETERAEEAVRSLAGLADAAAILDEYGLPVAATDSFAELDFAQAELDHLIAEAAREPDRLLKRAVEFSGVVNAFGIARLQDRPPRFLFVSLRVEAEESQPAAATQEADVSETQEEWAEYETESPLAEQPAATGADAGDDVTPAAREILEAGDGADVAGLHEPEEEPAQAIEPSATEEAQPVPDEGATDGGFHFAAPAQPVRFAFVIDRTQVFRSVSPELAATLGPNAADVVGRNWSEVARVFGFDLYGDIAKLLSRRDTWSGKTVMWPVQGREFVVPVDLAALPSFDAARQFEGFRGFGIIRAGEAVADPNRIGLALAGGSIEAAAQLREAEDIEHRRQASPEEKVRAGGHTVSNVVSLAARKRVEPAEALNRDESQAFSEIARTLNGETGDKSGPASEESVGAAGTDGTPDKIGRTATNAILSQLPIPVLIYRNGETLYANRPLLQLSGYETVQQLAAAGGIDALLSDRRPEPDDERRATLYCRDGRRFEIQPVLRSVPWEGGKALLFAFAEPGQAMGIPETAALEIAKASELQHILDTAADGIIIIDADARIVSINASGEALFGRRHEPAKRLNLFDLFAVESHRSLRDYMNELTQPGLPGLINDGREVIGKEAQGGLIPLFLTMGRMGSTGKFCVVLRDLTQWKKTEEELVKARRAAESANEQKSEFLARVSHEIRTPLNAIIGFSDVMIEERFGPIGNERYREYLRDINRSGVHVLDLINDLLDLSKIEAGKLDLHYEAVDLNQIGAETVALLQPQANRDRIIIRTSFSRAVPKVVADARSIRQIILNLVSNAIKFTPENGQVIVSTVYEGNGEVALRVRDTGRGMSADEIERAMKPFQQVGVISDRRGHGTGLGLPLTKALVEANRAYFDLESTPGEGTIAHVHFPTQRVLAD